MYKKDIGYIGLGIMGKPMAKNLLDAGYSVVGHNRSRGPVDDLIAYGGTDAGSPKETAEKTDVIISCLPDSQTVEHILLGEDGVIEGASADDTVIDMSTISPPVAEAIGDEFSSEGIDFLDAPISGGESGAVEGTLSIMIGGNEDAVEANRDVFETLGETIKYCGRGGAGQITKACNQLIVGGMIEIVAEGLVFAEKAGADLEAVYDAVSGGSCRGFVMDHHGSHMLEGNFEPGFYASYQYKDLRYVTEAAEAYGAPIPSTAVNHELFKSLVESGRGDDKNSAIITVLERLAGGAEARFD
ncbi:MAG: NAD(P)-binding domain-containing protein [Natronomonas sp.]|uniref:NAD(P)-dependent oxidoreductase n=1 Tax=Natronomonas sp. TaxID=2184060 RepID=UPI0028704A43|nr:NAD(P)-binding domain-containing protein [Natronomonas sp.]MDR9432155.1 NAD(P)-binding domain-containing protein [Natronomonas sp.]